MGTYGPSVANTVLADKRMLQKAAEATGYFANGKGSLSFMDLEVSAAAFSPEGNKSVGVWGLGWVEARVHAGSRVRCADGQASACMRTVRDCTFFLPTGRCSQLVGRGESKCMIWQPEHRLETLVYTLSTTRSSMYLPFPTVEQKSWDLRHMNVREFRKQKFLCSSRGRVGRDRSRPWTRTGR